MCKKCGSKYGHQPWCPDLVEPTDERVSISMKKLKRIRPMCGEPTEDGIYVIGKCTSCGWAEMVDPVWINTPLLEHCGECPSCFEEDYSITIHKLKEMEGK